MFDSGFGVGLLPGESDEVVDQLAAVEDQVAYEVTCRELADGWVDPDRHVLPDDLDEWPVGFLSVLIEHVDRSKLNGHDLVNLLRAESRVEAAVAGRKMTSVAEIAHCPPGNADSPVERSLDEVEYAEAEIAAALTLTRRSAGRLADLAVWLDAGGVRVREAMGCGLAVDKAEAFYRALFHLDQPTVEAVLDVVLDEAQGLTTGQLGYRISRLVMVEDPDGAKSSFQEGLKDRKVISHANPDFTGCLHLCSCHPADVAAATRYIDRIAKQLKTSDDDRSWDEMRSDVAISLLQGINPLEEKGSSSRGGDIHLTVPLVTLADLADLPGDLTGYAPVVADIARQIGLQQVEGKWTWTVTHDGEAVATGTTKYRPTVAQRRQARADYRGCVHPGCRMPAIDCDLDHRTPHGRGGRTHNDNLAPLCRYHHMMRHHTPWEYVRLPNGDHQWTSPLGHSYTRRRAPPDEA